MLTSFLSLKLGSFYVITHLLEPISYLLSCLVLSFFAFVDNRPRIKILAFYYLLATLIIGKAVLLALPNNSLYSFLSLLTFLCLGVYFYYTLVTSFKRKVVVFICLLDIIYHFINSFVLQQSEVFDSMGYVLLSLGIILMIFMFMHQVLNNVSEEPLAYNFEFWFASSQLVYQLGSFGIFLTYNYLTTKILSSELYSVENRSLLEILWGVHNVLLFLSSLITTGSVLWITSHRKSLSS